MRGPEAGAHNTRPMKAAPPPSRRGLAWRLRPCRSPQRWSSSRLQSLGVCGGGITGMAFDLPLLPLHRLRRSLSIRPWAKVSATISSSDRPTLQAFETGSGGGSLGPIRKFAHPGRRRFRAHLGPPPFPSSGPLWPRSSCGTRVVVGWHSNGSLVAKVGKGRQQDNLPLPLAIRSLGDLSAWIIDLSG